MAPGLDDALKRQNRRTSGEWLYKICELPAAIAQPVLPTRPRRRGGRPIGCSTARATGGGPRVCFNTGAGSRWQEKAGGATRRGTARSDPAGGRRGLRRGRWRHASRSSTPRCWRTMPALVDAGTDHLGGFAGLIAVVRLGPHPGQPRLSPRLRRRHPQPSASSGPPRPGSSIATAPAASFMPELDCIACYQATCPLDDDVHGCPRRGRRLGATSFSGTCSAPGGARRAGRRLNAARRARGSIRTPTWRPTSAWSAPARRESRWRSGLIDRAPRVVVLEGGGAEPDQASQDLYRGAKTGHAYYGLDACRVRAFGGSTNPWGGWCRPLDAIDFRERAWVSHSGWPFRPRAR